MDFGKLLPSGILRFLRGVDAVVDAGIKETEARGRWCPAALHGRRATLTYPPIELVSEVGWTLVLGWSRALITDQ